MTAHELIDSIFARAQDGPLNERRITRDQLTYLKDLIGADPEGAAFGPQGPGVWVWAPSGRKKYIITEDLNGKRHKIARLANLISTDAGRLF
jgi:hypothetical protein